MALNGRLSQDRAESVRSYLIAQGVAGDRISATGMGAQYPVATNANEAGRQQNRRVEIEIVPDQAAERSRVTERLGGGHGKGSSSQPLVFHHPDACDRSCCFRSSH
jgi:hypothetical protein